MPVVSCRVPLVGVAVLLYTPFAPPLAAETVLDKLGHSQHGKPFDTGPRQKPWRMEGIGVAHFPITTKNPEVQMWFDQGNALLHSFWDYEAERVFRWCIKLEPDNPMPYWGLARASIIGGLGGENRPAEMIREAVKRKKNASAREQLYIDAFAAELLPDPAAGSNEGEDKQPGGRPQVPKSRKILETICVRYPDDMEARALLAFASLADARYGAELMIREVLAKQPDHPGAHHYRIHNWDYHEPEQALVSAARYGEIAPGIGHALHMPGHIFSIVGMWSEAAISMDAATRAEKRYMKEQLTFPFNQWNYGHNRNYLSYIQEQLGMVNSAIFGARQLLSVPLDPDANSDHLRAPQSTGIAALARAALKYEKWDDILDDKNIPWRDIPLDRMNRAYFEARAWFAKGDAAKAEKCIETHAKQKKDIERPNLKSVHEIQARELRARVLLARGDTLQGLGVLAEAAQREYDMQKGFADPPDYPQVIYTSLGDEYLRLKSPLLAIQAYEKALTLTANDLFSLAGLVRAYAATGETDKAKDALARLLFVTTDADKDLAVINRAKATGITAVAHDSSPAPQRNYLRTSLERFGPERWEPYAAPQLEVRDADGKRVTLEEYRGKNVMLVFYLGQECPHCMRQLHTIGEKRAEWNRLGTVVLAVSSRTPDKNKAALKDLGDLPIRLLSDLKFESARRFHSYDDFEEMELHSTILIDRKSRVYWARTGGDPFSDTDFLVKQLERMNATAEISQTQ